MILNRAAAAGRRLLAATTAGQQGLQGQGRGLASLPTPKFFDYQASIHSIMGREV